MTTSPLGRQATGQTLSDGSFQSWFQFFFSIRWRNFKTFVEENSVDETDDIVFFIQGGFPSLLCLFLSLSGASIGDNLSQIEIYENGLKKAENFEVRISFLRKSIFVEKTPKSKEL